MLRGLFHPRTNKFNHQPTSHQIGALKHPEAGMIEGGVF
jgi:hypothetical protein